MLEKVSNEEETGVCSNFINSIKTEVTKEIYEYHLKSLLEVLRRRQF
jgi:hypothetical protein